MSFLFFQIEVQRHDVYKELNKIFSNIDVNKQYLFRFKKEEGVGPGPTNEIINLYFCLYGLSVYLVYLFICNLFK